MRNGNEIWDVLGDSRKRRCGPWAEIGKYWPDKEPIRLQDLLPCPLKMRNESSELFLSVIQRLKRTTAHKVKPSFVLRSKWLKIRNFTRDVLLVISSFFCSIVMVFVMRTDKENLPSREKEKENTSVCKTLYRLYQSFLLLVIDSFSRHLFDDFCKRHNVHRELIGTEVGSYTGTKGGLNNSHTRRVKCIIFLFQSEIIYPLLLF